LKAFLGYCPTRKPKTPVEISDQFGFSKVYESITEAGVDCGVPASTLKYALDNGKPSFKRRSDKKKNFVKPICEVNVQCFKEQEKP